MSLRVRLLFSFPHYQILAVTIILSLVGVSEIVLSILGYVQKIWGYEMGGGIWGGAAAFVAGVMGILAANKKGVGIVRLFLISSVLSCFLSIPVAVLSAGGLDFNSGFYRNIQGYMKINYSSTKLVHGFLLALAVAQFAICLTTSLVCLKHLYWNEWVIKRQHAKHLRQMKEENKTNRHRASRASTSSSTLLVDRNSEENSRRRRRKHKHRRRRSRSSENCSHGNDSVVNHASQSDTPDERRQRQSNRRENGPDNSNLHTITSANDPLVSDASRIPEVGSNLMSVNSAAIPSHNVRSTRNDSLRACAELNNFQHPLPIEDDEELPPYEATLRPNDDESVFPLSISENASHRSSTISSEDDEVQAWDSVSQVQNCSPRSPAHSSFNCLQETDVKFKYCPTASVMSDSSSLPIGSKVFINSENKKTFGSNSDQNVRNNKMTDPQGVSYHEFTRDGDKIIRKQEKQRSQSFLRERAMAKEGARNASRKSSVQENSEREDEKINMISPLDNQESEKHCFTPQTHQAPPKPPRQSFSESSTMHEILQQKGTDFLQNKYDSNESTSSLSKDIQFIKEGPPMQYAPSPEQKLPETPVSPFSEVSWHLLKDIPSKQSQSEFNAATGVKPKAQPNDEGLIPVSGGSVPVGIQNRVVTSELQKPKFLGEYKQSPNLTVSKKYSSNNVSESINHRQLSRFPHAAKSTSTIPSDKYSKGFMTTSNLSNRKDNGQPLSLTPVKISNFSPEQTSTMKKDRDNHVRTPKTVLTDESSSSPVVPFQNKSDSCNSNRGKNKLSSNPDRCKGLRSHDETKNVSKNFGNMNKIPNDHRKSDGLSMEPDSSDLPAAAASASSYRYDCDVSDALMPIRTDHIPMDGSNSPSKTVGVGACMSPTHQNDTQKLQKPVFIQQSNPIQPYPLQKSEHSQELYSTSLLNQSPKNHPDLSNTTQQNPSQLSHSKQKMSSLPSVPSRQDHSQESCSSQQHNSPQRCRTGTQQDPAQSRPTQENSSQSSPMQQNPAQSSSTQQNSSQSRLAQQNPSQSNPTQQNSAQPIPTQQSPSQSNPTQQNSAQPIPTQQSPSQSNPTQQSPSQASPTQQNPAQPSPTQQNSAQQNPSQQLSPTQQNKPMYSLLL